MKNYYETLEVNQKASKEIIEKAYKVLVKKYHPDLYIGEKKVYAEKKIKEINEAYHILSDEFLREQYDREYQQQEELGMNRDNNYAMKQNNKRRIKRQDKVAKVGSFASMFDLTKQLIHDIARSKEKREEIKEVTKKDILAILLTIVAMIIIGIILWFIPFTNSWMRELLFENPVFNWIAGLFSK